MQTEQGIQKDTRISKPVVKQRLYTIKEAAIVLSRPVSSVRGLIWKGLLPYIQTGRIIYVDEKDINDYIESNKVRMT
jgi:excisionase family DNA binding protein